MRIDKELETLWNNPERNEKLNEGEYMKNISDSLDELRDLIKNLDKKLDKIIERNSPPEDVVELFKKIKEENVVK
jgi:hypothetical protein